jgi:DNA-binding NarL/FixJ family response regulator
MNAKIRILIAEPNYLIRRGLEALIAENPDFDACLSATNAPDLFSSIESCHPDVIITDYNHFAEGVEFLKSIRDKAPQSRILVITDPKNKAEINQAIEFGACSFLLKECDHQEITEAISKTALNQKFFCNRIVDHLVFQEREDLQFRNTSCSGLNVTEREIEIISLIAEGLSNKEIAEKLFLSTHTVTTHRKNIMGKLHVNNTAGLVLYAVRNDLVGPNKFLFS